MKKKLVKKTDDDIQPEYDLSKLRGGVRGKYFRQATAGTNLVLIEPGLAAVFPDAAAVNRALRLVVEAASAVAEQGRTQSVKLKKRTGKASAKTRRPA